MSLLQRLSSRWTIALAALGVLSISPVMAAASAPGASSSATRVTVAGSGVVNFSQLAEQAARTGTFSRPPVRPLLTTEMNEGEDEHQEPYAPLATGLNRAFVPFVASPSPTTSFIGLDDIPMVDSSFIVIPPDVNGAVGPTKIFQALNNNYRIIDKATGNVLSTVGVNTFWASTGATANGYTDPRSLFDPYIGRFITISQGDLANSTGNSLLIGISDTNDPSGSWHLYRTILFLNTTSALYDFPTLGFNKNWVTVSINRFNSSGASQGNTVITVHLPTLIANAFTAFRFDRADFVASPAETYSATTDTEYVVVHLSSGGGTYRLDTITGSGPGAPTYTPSGTLTRGGTNWAQGSGQTLPQSAPNAGASTCGATPCKAELTDAQVRTAPVFRGGSIYYVQTVGVPAGVLTHTAAQWTKITTPSGTFVDGGRVEDPTATATNGGKWYSNPSIAVNANGDFLVGCTQWSSAQHPSSVYSMHLAGDANGSIRDAVVFHAGEDYYHKTFSGTRNRWGDFTTAQVDPNDDMTLWTVQEYGKTRTSTNDGTTGANGSKWSTWWAGVAPPNVTIDAGPSQNEGNAGLTAFTFTVRLSSAYGLPITVNYHTSDGSATIVDNDYQAVTGSVTIPAGSTTMPVTVNVVGDTKCESNETFNVTLDSANNNITLGATTTSVGTIVNDEVLTITASAGTHGSISPSGATNLSCGQNQGYTISADPGFVIDDVLVDGSSVGAVSSYTFNDVTANHTIAASFAGVNTVTPVGSACITPVHACIPIPFDISRTDNTGILAYHVRFHLSANIDLCAPITEGSYLNSSHATSFHTVSNGGGSYSVDDATLLPPCGVTDASGNLFNISIKATGTGPWVVTVDSVVVRDCSNRDLHTAIGGPATGPIDNSPVTVAAISNQTVAETATLTVTPSATQSSCSTGSLTWSQTGLPAGATFSTSTGQITWTPDCQAFENGPDYGPVTVKATDADGHFGTASFSIHVTDTPGTVTVTVSDPPATPELSPITVTPSAALSACATGPVTWTVAPALPAGANFDPSTGVVTWTPACGQAGTYGPFTLTATAASGQSGTGSFSMTVTHKAGSVTVTVSDPPPTDEQSLITVTPSASLSPCAASPVTWSISPALPAGANFDPSTGEVTWTPACGQAGTYGPFTLTATAATGESGTGSFSITVNHKVGTVAVSVTDPPATPEQSLITVTPSATLSPCAAGPVTWSVSPALPAGANFDPSTGEVTWTPACGEAGSYGPFTLTATAATGESGTGSFSITVTHKAGTVTVTVSDPPPTPEQSLITVTPGATLTACAAGPVTWSISPALPAGANFDPSTGVVTWTPACGEAGSYGPFTLTATAATGESGTGSFSITVTHKAGTVTVTVSDPPPTNEQSLITVTPSATLGACATGPVTWSIAPPLPGGASIDPSTGVVTWTPGCGQAGTYGPFTLTATAATGESGTGTFSITVTHKAGSVTVSVTSPPATNELSPITVTPSATLTACAAGPVTWSISPALPAGANFDPSTGKVTWTPACGTAGTYGPFTLTATAATGESGTGSFSITVKHKPGTVTITATNQTVAEGATLSYAPNFTLGTCAASPLTWTATGLPAGATFDNTTGRVMWTPDCAAFENGPNYGPVKLTATAATGEVGTGQYMIHVNDTPQAVSAITDLVATQLRNGNDADGTTKILLTFTPPAGTTVQIYRAKFGGYPTYDDAGGSVPTPPASYPPPFPWVLTSATNSGDSDEPGPRDFWYYVAFAKNSCGDASPRSNVTGGTLDYHLGDVTDGVTQGHGDNKVQIEDISLLGAHYGASGAAIAGYEYLDVGPTTDHYINGRPTTDLLLDFEDFILYAINYGVVSGPTTAKRASTQTSDVLSLTVSSPAPDRLVAHMVLSGSGALQGLATALKWNTDVLEPIDYAAGQMLTDQHGTALSGAPGHVDMAILGLRGIGLAGAGELATVTFRIKGTGEYGLSIKSAIGRSSSNTAVPVTIGSTNAVDVVVPSVTAFAPPSPNPFLDATTLAYSLARGGSVSLEIFSVDGRRVRSLVQGVREAGSYRETWDGRGDGGLPLSSGVYYARLATSQGVFHRKLVHLQ